MSPSALIVSPHPGVPSGGGIERFCTLLSQTLEADGWSVNEVGPRGSPGVWTQRLGAGPFVQTLAAGRAVRGHRPDLIVSNGALGGFERLDTTVPRIHVLHGTFLVQVTAGDVGLATHYRLRRLVGLGLAERWACRNAIVVAVSERVSSEARRFYRLPVDHVIHNGVDVRTFCPRDQGVARSRLGLPAEARLALFVGRLESRKGADLLLPACQSAGYELVVAGREAPASARHLGILDHEELAWAYAAADCVLFPSRYEACAYVALEALASEVPLLTTRTGWMPTLLQAIPEYRSLLIWPEVGDIAARLRSLGDADRSSLLSAAAHHVREHNSLAVFARRWTALARQVIDSPQSAEHH